MAKVLPAGAPGTPGTRSPLDGLEPPFTLRSNIVYFHDWRYVFTGAHAWLGPDGNEVAMMGPGPVRPIGEHLGDFKAALTAKGVTTEQVRLVYGRATRVFDGCGFASFVDVSSSRVMDYIHGLRADVTDDNGNMKRGISAQTFNFYLQSVKQFCRGW